MLRRLIVLFTALLMVGVVGAQGAGDPLPLPPLNPTPGVLSIDAWRGSQPVTLDQVETQTRALSESIGRADDVARFLRAPAGEDFSEGFDLVNAQVWHSFGFKGGVVGGARQRIAVIDFGFGAPGALGDELSCVASQPNLSLEQGTAQAGDSRRGLDMTEILCDLAPESRVRLYKVTTSNELHDAITTARVNSEIILIGADFGADFSPGDGTLGRTASKDPYAAINSARSAGVIVIAAAGNAGESYRAFSYSGGVLNLTVTAKPGDLINLSWNDWDTNPNAGGAREDLTVSLSGTGMTTLNKPDRATGANPSYQFIVPSCTTNGLGFCTSLTLGFGGLSGGAPSVVIQANVSGIGRAISAPAGALLTFGTLSRPADSANVIAVGAVCGYMDGNFPALPYSARGPIYAVGGSAPLLTGGILAAPMVKPDLVGPAHISTSELYTSSLSGCDAGFPGTQAAAAHVAGMAALLRQNVLSVPAGSDAPDAVLDYLRAHSIDLPYGAQANGYDFTYGAGFATLGRPDFNSSGLFGAPPFGVPNALPAGRCDNGVVFVGPYNTGSASMNGSLSFPYTHIAHAVNVQNTGGTGRCVVVLPGEYVTPVEIESDNGVGVYAYNAVTGQTFGSSQFMTHVSYAGPLAGGVTRRAGVYFSDSDGVDFEGFAFVPSEIYAPSIFPRPAAVAIDSSSDLELAGLSISGFGGNQSLIEVFDNSMGVLLRNSDLRNNTLDSAPGVIGVEDSGSVGEPIIVRGVTLSGNSNTVGLWDRVGLADDGAPFFTNYPIAWVSILRTLDSYTVFESNQLLGNQAEVLIQALTRDPVAPYETAILGNAMVGNTIKTDDFLDNPGPLIHVFFMQRIWIVNNTIANNTLTGAGTYGTLIARGDGDDTNSGALNRNGSLTSVDARWEVHNNLIYKNATNSLIGDTDPGVTSAGCTDLSGAANMGARANWFNQSGATSNCGDSFGSVNSPINGNLRKDPLADGGTQFLFGGADPLIPTYYALIGAAAESDADGVDEGLDSFVTTNFPSFASGLDARGGARRLDGDAVLAGEQIDIGAYEVSAGAEFVLLSPDNGVTASDQTPPVVFMWGESTTAEAYDFSLLRIVSGTQANVLTLTGLSPTADADGLTCTAGFCTLIPSPAPSYLSGEHRWTVSAVGPAATTPALNAPFSFTLGRDLISNGSFEQQGATKKLAANWKITNVTGDKRVCGSKGVASDCAFQLTSTTGLNSTLKQIIKADDIGGLGEVVNLIIWFNPKAMPVAGGTVKLKIKYVTIVAADVLTLNIPSGGDFLNWSTVTMQGSLDDVVKKYELKIVIKPGGGKTLVDDIALLLGSG